MFGGMCSDGTISTVYATVITFKSTADQKDWLHQNAMVESSSNPTGYAELVVGNLWAVGARRGCSLRSRSSARSEARM